MWRSDYFTALPEAVTAFAWSAPMRELAATIGISDVGLKKLLNAQGVVTPPQGHWNRVKAGLPVPAPPKPRPRGPGESGRIRLDARFRDHVAEATATDEAGPFTSALVPEDLCELRERELAAIGRVAVPRDLSRPPAGLARLLRKESDRRAKAAASRWSWDEAHFDTPLAQRQLRLLAGLFTALAKRGYVGDASEDNYALRAHCTIGEETLRLHFEVLGKYATEVIGSYYRPARDLPAKTPLRLVLDRTLATPAITSWADTGGLPLEKQLAQITADLVVAGEASFRQGLREAREREEQFRRWEEERREAELKALAEKRLADLRTSGELLREAEEIRALVARVEAAMLRGEREELTPAQVARWKAWALARADAIDPVLSGQVLTHLVVPRLDEAYDCADGVEEQAHPVEGRKIR